MDSILDEDMLYSMPEEEVRDTRDVFQAIEPDTPRKTHARWLSEKSAVKGQRLIRPEKEMHQQQQHEQTENDPVRRKRVAKLAPIKMLREVYLPKLVTVGNLAKILNVRLGKCNVRVQAFSADPFSLAPLQRALLKAGFEDVNYDHCELCSL